MDKRFNIHDWQAKQRQQRLTENDDAYQKRQKSQTPGGNPKHFYNDDSIIGKLKKDPDYIKKLNAKNAKKDVSENIDNDVERKINNFIRNMGDDLGIPLQHVVYNIIRVIKSQNYDGLEEHHNDEDFPGKDLSAWDLLDKIKAGNEDLYNKVEDFMKSMKEMSITSGEASFKGGNSMTYMPHKKKK